MSIDSVIEVVAEEYGVSVDDIKSRKRDALTMDARQMAMFVLSYMDGVSIVEVAYVLRASTYKVSYGIEKVYEMMEFDRKVKEHYDNIKKKLDGFI